MNYVLVAKEKKVFEIILDLLYHNLIQLSVIQPKRWVGQKLFSSEIAVVEL